jgi:hypothetical protein
MPPAVKSAMEGALTGGWREARENDFRFSIFEFRLAVTRVELFREFRWKE